MIPIWLDKVVSLGSSSTPVRFRIQFGGTTIYEGVCAPVNGSCSVRINDICADYMQSLGNPAVHFSSITPARTIGIFTIDKYSGSAWSNVEGVTFIWDWSYNYDDYAVSDTSASLSRPVVRMVNENMQIVYSCIKSASNTITARWYKGSTAVGTAQTITLTRDYSGSPFGVAVIPLRAGADNVAIFYSSTSYERYFIGGLCTRYCLRYRNALGGWDTLPLLDHETKTDGYTRHTSRVLATDTIPSGEPYAVPARASHNWQNEVARRWTFRTPVLTDEGAGNMHHLLGSTSVWLVDFGTDNDGVFPVNIADSECVYKTYRNQQARPQYTLTLEWAGNPMTRR